MNQAEFNEFKSELAGAMPHVAEWFRSITAKQQESFRCILWSVVRDVDLSKASLAIDAIDPETKPEQILTALHGKLLRGVKSKLGNPLTPSFLLIHAAIAAGKTVAEATAEIFGPVDESKEPRYKCPYCRDTGIVEVWTRESIRAAIEDDIRSERLGCGVMACGCEAGDGFVGISPHRFSLSEWCPCKRGDVGSERNWIDLKRWVNAKMSEAKNNEWLFR